MLYQMMAVHKNIHTCGWCTVIGNSAHSKFHLKNKKISLKLRKWNCLEGNEKILSNHGFVFQKFIHTVLYIFIFPSTFYFCFIKYIIQVRHISLKSHVYRLSYYISRKNFLQLLFDVDNCILDFQIKLKNFKSKKKRFLSCRRKKRRKRKSKREGKKYIFQKKRF